LVRADAAWRDTYSKTFGRVYDEALTELLAEQHDAERAV
jgi:hypothetical protein